MSATPRGDDPLEELAELDADDRAALYPGLLQKYDALKAETARLREALEHAVPALEWAYSSGQNEAAGLAANEAKDAPCRARAGRSSILGAILLHYGPILKITLKCWN